MTLPNSTARVALAVALLAVTWFGGSKDARAQEWQDQPRWRPLFALNLDGGFAFDLGQTNLHNTAALGAGLSLHDGEQLWSATVDVLGMRNQRRVVGASIEYLLKVPIAVGATASALYDLEHRVTGLKAGVNINIIHLTGMIYFDEPLVKLVYVYMRVPLGFIAYLWATEQ